MRDPLATIADMLDAAYNYTETFLDEPEFTSSLLYVVGWFSGAYAIPDFADEHMNEFNTFFKLSEADEEPWAREIRECMTNQVTE